MVPTKLRAGLLALVVVVLGWVMSVAADKPTTSKPAEKGEAVKSKRPVDLRFGEHDKVLHIVRGRQTGWWYVKCQCGEKDAYFIIDTGCTNSCMQPEYAKLLGHPVKWTGEEGRSDIDGTKGKFYGVIRAEMEFAVLPKVKHSFFIQEMATVAEVSKEDGLEPVFGVLGLNFVEYYGAVLDTRNEQLVVRDPLPLCEDILGKPNAEVQGIQWYGVSTETGGKVTACEMSQEFFVIFTPDRMVYVNGKVKQSGRLTVSPDASPKQLTYRSNGMPSVQRYIYKLDGDTLVLAMNQTTDDAKLDKGRPTGFDTSKGEAAIVLRFKQKKEK